MGTGCLPAPSLHGSHNGLHLGGIMIDLLENVLLFVGIQMRQPGNRFLLVVVVVVMSRCCYSMAMQSV